MIENTIAQRYARALIKVAKQENKVEDFSRELLSFVELNQQSPDLFDALCNSGIELIAREKVIDQISQKMSLSQNMIHFFKLLLRKGRMSILLKIQSVFEEMAYDILGKAVMTVESSVELKEDYYNQLQEAFAKKTGKQILLKKKISPELLGGLKVFLKDQVYDYSLTTQLQNMKTRMLEH